MSREISQYINTSPPDENPDRRSLCERISSGDFAAVLNSEEVSKLAEWVRTNQNTIIKVAAAYGIYRIIRR